MDPTYEINPSSRSGRRHEKQRKHCTYIRKSPVRVRPPRVPPELPKHNTTLPNDQHVQGKSVLEHTTLCTEQPKNRLEHDIMPLGALAEIMYRDLTEKMTAGDFFETRPHNKQLLLPISMPSRQLLTPASSTT